MATSAAMTTYRNEFIYGYEQCESLVRKTVTTEAMTKGATAVFLVGDSGGATAVTRGLNGMIPRRHNNMTQLTATLVEWHDLAAATNFNIFISQGDQRKLMQHTTQCVLNRQSDQDIITELATATQDTGAAVPANLSTVMHAITILGNNAVPLDGNVSALITPAFYANLMQTTEFASADFVNNKPFANTMTMFRWAGVNFIVHPNLPGAGTADESTFFYHKSAIGHAINMAEMQVMIGYNEEQDYSWARASSYMGSKLLQNDGVVVVHHDGANYAAL